MECTCHGAQSNDFKQSCNCVLAIATVPLQQWGAIYDPMTAMDKGTIFADLDLPFFEGGDSVGQ